MDSSSSSSDSVVVEAVRGRAVPVRGDDIDTDRIIPARFLRCVTFEGIGEHAFEDDRRDYAGPQGREGAGKHPFDQPTFQGAQVLLVNRNFGCGSSREHAPQSLMRWGIRGIVGESFAEIFFGNCVALGVPCFTVSKAVAEALQSAVESDPTLEVRLDVRAGEVAAGAETYAAAMPAGVKESFLKGSWDATGLLRRRPEEIEAVASSLLYLHGFSR